MHTFIPTGPNTWAVEYLEEPLRRKAPAENPQPKTGGQKGRKRYAVGHPWGFAGRKRYETPQAAEQAAACKTRRAAGSAFGVIPPYDATFR